MNVSENNCKILMYIKFRQTTNMDIWIVIVLFHHKSLIPKYWQKKQNNIIVMCEVYDSLCMYITKQRRVTTFNPSWLAQGPHGLWENHSTIPLWVWVHTSWHLFMLSTSDCVYLFTHTTFMLCWAWIMHLFWFSCCWW